MPNRSKQTRKNTVGKMSKKQKTNSRKRQSKPNAQISGAASVPRSTPVAFYPHTDAGNAELFAGVLGNSLRFDHNQRRWLRWGTHWWTQDENGNVQRMAKEVARLRLKAASTPADVKFARKQEARARLEAMLELAKYELPLSIESYDEPLYVQ